MTGYELQHYKIKPPEVLRGFEYSIQHELNPPITSKEDPRFPVIFHVLKAMGMVPVVNGGFTVDEALTQKFIGDMQARIDATASKRFLEKNFRGSFTHYTSIALGRLPKRIFDVAERALNVEKGPVMQPVTKAFLYARGRLQLTDAERSEQVDPATSRLLPAIASQAALVPGGRREIAEVAERAMQYQPVEIASIAAQHTMVIQIRDSIIEGAALAGLESRGLIRDLGQGKSQGEQIVEALRDDFKEGRLSVLDFEGKVKELAQLVGVMQPQSDADLIRSLEEQLSRFKIQREFPPPTPI